MTFVTIMTIMTIMTFTTSVSQLVLSIKLRVVN